MELLARLVRGEPRRAHPAVCRSPGGRTGASSLNIARNWVATSRPGLRRRDVHGRRRRRRGLRGQALAGELAAVFERVELLALPSMLRFPPRSTHQDAVQPNEAAWRSAWPATRPSPSRCRPPASCRPASSSSVPTELRTSLLATGASTRRGCPVRRDAGRRPTATRTRFSFVEWGVSTCRSSEAGRARRRSRSGWAARWSRWSSRTAGHEVAYNRWYERDHFYAGCMIGAWTIVGRPLRRHPRPEGAALPGRLAGRARTRRAARTSRCTGCWPASSASGSPGAPSR